MAEPTASNFPTTLDNNTSLGADQINIKSFTLASSVSNTDTTIPATAISGITAPFYLLADSELIYVEGISGSNFTPVTRGAGGTTAAAHTGGITLYAVYAANLYNQLKRAIIAIETEMGLSAAAFTKRVGRDFTGKTSAPGVGDDTADGYKVGDRWLDESNDRIYEAIDVTGGAAVWIESLPAAAYGSYTPTLTNVTNVAASTAFSTQWMRIGTMVLVSGKFDADPTGAGACEIGISLPIASNFAGEAQAGGTFHLHAVASEGGSITADATNDRLKARWTAVDTSNRTFGFIAMYIIV